MKHAGSLRAKYLTHLSHPVQDRRIYQAISLARPLTILEFGVASGERASRMIELALRYQDCSDLQYIGVDLFEDRPPQNPGLTLKRAYALLSEWRASVRLIPGDPSHVMAHVANSLGQVNLVVISGDQGIVPDSKAWFYFPRILNADSLVFEEMPTGATSRNGFQQVSLLEIHARAEIVARQFRRAA